MRSAFWLKYSRSTDSQPRLKSSLVQVKRALVRIAFRIQSGHGNVPEDFLDLLADFGAFRIQEDYLLAVEAQHARPLEDAWLVQLLIHFLQEGHFLRQRDFEGVDPAGAVELCLDGVLLCQAHREGDALRGCAGVLEGFIKDRCQIAQVR